MTKDPINILLVDDQPAKLLSYEATLQSLGENLIKAGSAQEALEHLLKEDIAIVLSDVCMPELDGFELARMIRNHPRFQHTSAEEAPETIKQANWLYLRFTTLSFRDGATPSVKLKTSRCRERLQSRPRPQRPGRERRYS
jgi:CheY-like chemotaxis protein